MDTNQPLTQHTSGTGRLAKILVIDDDRGVRHLLNALLRRKGYDVVLAETGQKGLELFSQEHPDVIVLDLNMPEMDGLTVLRHVRQLNPTQPVIMLTGTWTAKTEQQVRAHGVTEIVKKGASIHPLEDALTRLLKTISLVG